MSPQPEIAIGTRLEWLTHSLRWYMSAVIDGWVHYEEQSLPFGYVIVGPIFEAARITSTVIFLWATYTIVWKELEYRFNDRPQKIWWPLAKCALLLAGLVSIFAVVLQFSLAIVWIQFLSLNIIADVATKRTKFEISMTAFFSAFGLLTLVATSWTLAKAGTWKRHNPKVCIVFVSDILFFPRCFS
jgi:hypothetical protein